MNNAERLINNLHKIFRNDDYLKDIFKAAGINLDSIEDKLLLLKQEFLFSTMSLERIEALEQEMAYKTKSSTIDGKRKEIETRWKIKGKSDLELLQKIADTWQAGAVIVRFIDGTIQLGFTNEIQEDYDLAALRNAIDEAKPAHLGSEYIYSEKIESSLNLNFYNTEEIEEDFINKKQVIDITCNYYNGIFAETEEVIENYG